MEAAEMNGHKRQRTGAESIVLKNYYENEVQVSRQKTKKFAKEVRPMIEALVKYVNQKDEHFDAEPVSVGSYTQGLGVDANRDYDFNIVFRYDPSEKSSRLVWNRIIKPLYYDFYKKPVSIFDQNVEIRHTSYILSRPDIGYSAIRLDMKDPDFRFTFDGDLISFKVQQRFGELLQEAMECKKLDEILNLSKKLHGPALKIETEITTDDGVKHPVCIDLSVIIRAQLPFLLEMGWPVPGAQWPSEDKIQSILEKGINVVAKKEFFWQLSFAELEKLLVKEIDKDDVCRKMVHRIMKSVYYTVCGDKASLSTYILKNVWFHECEKFPDPREWASDRLGERYRSCLWRLIDCSKSRVLLQYFDRRVNLLEGKDISYDVEKIRRFDFSPWQTRQC